MAQILYRTRLADIGGIEAAVRVSRTLRGFARQLSDV